MRSRKVVVAAFVFALCAAFGALLLFAAQDVVAESALLLAATLWCTGSIAAATGAAIAVRRSSTAFLCLACVAPLLLSLVCARLAVHWSRADGYDRLHPSIKPRASQLVLAGSPYCDKIRYCESLVEVSCHPETDGPLSYYNNTDGSLLAECGYWARPVVPCPPKQWEACAGRWGLAEPVR